MGNKPTFGSPVDPVRTHSDAPVIPAQKNQQPIPLEPRVLMDANLGWVFDDAGQMVDALEGISASLDHNFTDFSAFLDSFETAADTSVTALATYFDAEEQAHDFVANVVGLLRDAVDSLQSGAASIISDALGTGTTFESAVATSFGDALFTLAPNGYPQRNSLKTLFTANEIGAAITETAFSDGTVEEAIATLVATKTTQLTAASITAAQAEAALLNSVNTQLSTTSSNAFGLVLTDISDARGDVTFTEDAANNEVDVQITLNGFTFEFGDLVNEVFPNAILPQDLSFDTSGMSLGFSLASTLTTDTVTGDLTSVGFEARNFDFGTLLEVGGAVATSGASLSLGLLDLSVDAIDLATFRLVVDNDNPLTFSASAEFDATGITLVTDGSVSNLSVGMEISEAGDGTTFASLMDDAAYNLLSVSLSGTTDFVSGLNDTDASDDSKVFTAVLSASAVLQPGTPAATSAERISAFIASATPTFEVDLSGSVSDATVRAAMEDAVEALAVMTGTQIAAFLGDVGNSLALTLRNSIFDLDIPFTDISLNSLTTAIADVFGGIARTFLIDPAAIGFPLSQPLTSELTSAITSQTGFELDDTAIAALNEFKALSLRIPTGALDTSGNAVIEVVSIVLDDPALTNPASTPDEVLAAIVDQINTALAAYQITASLSGRAITFQSTAAGGASDPVRSFAIVGGTRRDGDLDDTNDVVDDTLSLACFGFGGAQLLSVTDVLANGATDTLGAGAETLLSFKEARGDEVVFGANFATEMVGVSVLRFVVEIDGVEHLVDVEKPAGGWTDASNQPLFDDIATAFNDAFTALGIPLTAATNAGGDGLSFEISAGGPDAVRFGINPEYLTRALSLDTLIEWVNVQLNDIPVLAGSELKLTEAGELIFVFPDITRSTTIGTSSALSGFNASDLGLGDLDNLSLSARLEAELSASLHAAVGIDLVGLALDLIGSASSGNAMAAEEDSAGVTSALLDNVFFADLALDAEITGTATNIQGSADLGIISVDIGATDSSLNFLALNAQLDVTLVGTDTTGSYNSHLTLQNLRQAIAAEGGLRALIGRYDLQGGIVTDGEGNAIDSAGDPATDATLQIVDADSYVLQGQETLVQFFASLGDISLNVAGVNDLAEDLVDGVNVLIATEI